MAISSVTATINGQQVTLEYNSSTGKYEATITAPAKSSYPLTGHYYPVSITANDDAGNSRTVDATDATLGESLRLVVKEKVKPTITILAPTAGQTLTTSTPKITAQLRDDDSGIDINTLVIKIDTQTVTATSTAVTGGYDIEYTPTDALTDGSHTVTITVSDHDGNAATAASAAFVVDTTPPSLSITSPVDGLKTNKSALIVSGTTNDATSNPVTITIKVNGTDAGAVTVGEDGAFSKTITLSDGENTIVITATDKAGKASTVTRTVTLRTKAPLIQSATLTPNPVDAGKTYVISVEVVEQ